MIKSLATLLLVASAALVASATSLPVGESQLQKSGSAQVALLPGEAHPISVQFDNAGWNSGVIVAPPSGQKYWDFSQGKALSVDVTNASADKQLRLTMRISSGSKEDKTYSSFDSSIGLNPGEKRTLNMLIPERRIYGVPAGVRRPHVVDSDKVNGIEFFMSAPYEGTQKDLASYQLSNFRVTGAPDETAAVDPAKFFPFIDIYGQYLHGDWPAKIHSDADLPLARAKEDAELAASPRPAEWDRFGGWATGPQLKATGAFRTEKYQGKWWFVDPDGRLFFSQGMDVLIASTDAVKSTGHENWFDFKVTADHLPFNDWNLRKKYGKDDYEPEFYATLAKRLEHWGINTIGDWGKADLILLDRTPYTLQLTDYNGSLARIAGGKLKFYDVFDPAYIKTMKNLVATAAAKNPAVEKSLTDPMCIGYFIDNELNFGNRNSHAFGDAILRSPATQPGKAEFVKDLQAKYGDIAKLNSAWETNYSDWKTLLAKTSVPSSQAYQADMDVFFAKAVDQYFRLCHDAIKSAAPDRLYLGCRFISTDAVRKVLYDASRKYCDVLTVNVYAPSVANFAGPDFPDMPVLVGEFHFGILDRGMFAPGLVNTGVTQEERALAYTRFVQGALANPRVVGTHWFQFRDQPITGRFDGEGYAIGFVDVADTPYAHLTAAAREVGEHMYDYRTRGKLTDAMR